MKYPLAIYPDAVNIVSPLIRTDSRMNPIRVTVRSRLRLRRAVYELARFFQKEMRYDSVQYGYEGGEEDPDHVAFLWVHPEAQAMGKELRVPCVGATCFRKREEGWAMQWVWVHPFFRRHGLLSDAWPEFGKEFGEFAVEAPLSDAMKAFLEVRQRKKQQ